MPWQIWVHLEHGPTLHSSGRSEVGILRASEALDPHRQNFPWWDPPIQRRLTTYPPHHCQRGCDVDSHFHFHHLPTSTRIPKYHHASLSRSGESSPRNVGTFSKIHCTNQNSGPDTAPSNHAPCRSEQVHNPNPWIAKKKSSHQTGRRSHPRTCGTNHPNSHDWCCRPSFGHPGHPTNPYLAAIRWSYCGRLSVMAWRVSRKTSRRKVTVQRKQLFEPRQAHVARES